MATITTTNNTISKSRATIFPRAANIGATLMPCQTMHLSAKIGGGQTCRYRAGIVQICTYYIGVYPAIVNDL
ncbi:hypothetical protein [Sulfitobacter mediterraneus]|uniref:hypothetical protein n=1 Tax=Sulfitobacter mediterraneus TaxID=83219 RepID=UPI00193A0D78|nr:hypothetical protein [Sulfitobacter mediterraneus]MBM1567616.1 hypothetical protein [Sulfitobacter mediterraneus]MBM1575488.1 hypothetical protein [Sulfitobacter mediterraneus]MBM1586632.1 hypothetical protein [Sulfitobacter mediterraneus]MBM1594505.1 hypothetical protein [Sulfitobacter mediterraneus]MBM1601842.1 hypothetical protein [Sulfitobacter mediterraneus]